MIKSRGTPVNLTEAQMAQGYTIILRGAYPTESNSRTIPYIDIYQGRSGLMETPVENLQRAAEEEQMRAKKRQSKKDEQKT
jgi:hypothetical protein